MKCKELQVGDWIQDKNGHPMQITKVGKDSACANLRGNECIRPFIDDFDEPNGIPLTKEMLDKNGFRHEEVYGTTHRSIIRSYNDISNTGVVVAWRESSEGRSLVHINCTKITDGKESSATIRRESYVHTLQHALRLVGLDELANNFKV